MKVTNSTLFPFSFQSCGCYSRKIDVELRKKARAQVPMLCFFDPTLCSPKFRINNEHAYKKINTAFVAYNKNL